MAKFIYVGDIHIKGKTPQNRTDNYVETLKDKLQQIHDIALSNNVNAIITAGDVFDKPDISNGTLVEFADLLETFNIPIYTTVGNHDIYSYNMETLRKSNLSILERMVENFHVYYEESIVVDDTEIFFQPYTVDNDINGFGYKGTYNTDGFKILVIHGMLTEEKIFNKSTVVETCETNADIVMSGHYHFGFGFKVREDNKMFVNPGSLTRVKASINEMKRDINVFYVDTEDHINSAKLIKLNYKNGEDVLDRSKIEAAQQREFSIQNFFDSINKGNISYIESPEDYITEIAKRENIDQKIVDITLEKIRQAEEELI